MSDDFISANFIYVTISIAYVIISIADGAHCELNASFIFAMLSSNVPRCDASDDVKVFDADFRVLMRKLLIPIDRNALLKSMMRFSNIRSSISADSVSRLALRMSVVS